MLYRFSVCILPLVLLAGCASQTALAPLSNELSAAQSRSAAASTYRVLYKFTGALGDGARPQAPLVAHNGAFRSTTEYGGTENLGTVYEVNPDGTERVLHSFVGGKGDGASPVAGLIRFGDKFYGVTQNGGTANRGTLFEIKGDGTSRIAYSFTDATGAHPTGDLTAVAGLIYGTTLEGGAKNLGAVFAVTADGGLRVLHSFTGAPDDGSTPFGGIALLGSAFYGTTYRGGKYDKGTVFEIAPDGKERVIYSFGGTVGDGENPANGLVAFDGALYGTTFRGGSSCCGTIFEVKANGNERIVTSLKRDTGNYPLSGLTAFNGSLYGTTTKGGKNNVGTVFEVKPAGSLRVLHSFDAKDGSDPRSNVIAHNGKLFGTTFNGGNRPGNGVVYELTP